MLSGPGKLRQTVTDAAQSIRTVAEGTGRFALAAVAVAGAALLVALAALLAVMKLRKAAA